MILFNLLLLSNIDTEYLLNKASEKINIPLSELRIEKEGLEFFGSGNFRTKIFDLFISDPLKIDTYLRILTKTILDNPDSLWMLSYFSWARIDEGMRRGLIERPDKKVIDALLEVDKLDEKIIELLNGFYDADYVKINEIPEGIKKGIFLILMGIKNSIEILENTNKNLLKDDYRIIMEKLTNPDDEIPNRLLEEMIKKTDFKSISSAAIDLSYIIQSGIDFMKNEKIGEKIEIKTKYGVIAIGSENNEIYGGKNYLLIIDFGGDDNYFGGGVSDIEHPVSIIIDFSGNDNYKSEYGCGSGINGLGFVVELGGNDNYKGEKIGLGTGIFGEGIILDLKGDDTYETDIYGEGAGLSGTGIISDISGNDKYIGFQGCQGFGYVKGCGILIDKSGDDIYIARDDTIRFPSPQTKEHNVSLSQGVGFGIRADYTDGHSLAGGVGILIDGEGDDKYSCGVFGEGCGYWFGSGFLIDYKGNDEYNGIWYVQGASAHFAIGVLIDSSGNDTYTGKMNMSQGAGHDFSLGYLLDYEGNDEHNAPNLSLGAGNANGMGIFIDIEGDDEYNTNGGFTLGAANTDAKNSIRNYIRTIGIFIDAEGKDKYKEIGRNRKSWKRASSKKEINSGIDF